MKALLWEGDGFLLLYKRLDNGCFQWQRNGAEAKLLTHEQYIWLLQGLSTEQPKAIKQAQKRDVIYHKSEGKKCPRFLYAKVLKKMDIMRFVWYNKRNNPRTADYKAVRGTSLYFVVIVALFMVFV